MSATDARDLILAKIANIRAEQEADWAATQAAILALPQPDPSGRHTPPPVGPTP